MAFADLAAGTVVVHESAWNRLDVSDPVSGALLTARNPMSYKEDEPRPDHYLDYFHGRLSVSPGQRWIADDGWIWQPFGVPRVWDLQRWVLHNPWESEDGPSVRELCWRGYYWGNPMTWAGPEVLVISGLGTDDDHILAGVRVFNVATGDEVNTFPGPEGELFWDGALFSASAAGLAMWDIDTGERTGRLPGFLPTRHHRGCRELVQVTSDAVNRCRLP